MAITERAGLPEVPRLLCPWWSTLDGVRPGVVLARGAGAQRPDTPQ